MLKNGWLRKIRYSRNHKGYLNQRQKTFQYSQKIVIANMFIDNTMQLLKKKKSAKKFGKIFDDNKEDNK